ncbi:protein of unknown function [Taphrina deformans PYCC 5710]|uniref:Matrin-type domain-containing protein n=1 Tax=Taphrina deformans (strain PYCC 5710 / ATCC 11124 / CBS 356.35 / IMI 108563 / JCM 9778 / NBRC 8474) TaxID=1097556 RepID=R4XNE8_TAPDE|nr:protein of unknown function [Taphrina deformans PYCC 5710]|eukprot:CCG84769.1 protein of unknown function [Taphrina deformans PYCC 5710]
METILERQRHAHEDIERLEQAISDRLLAHPRTIRDRLQLDHETAEMLEKIQLRSYNLRELYADTDGSRAIEIGKLSAASGLETFYTQLSSVKDYHQRYPDNIVENLTADYEITLPDPNNPVDPEDRIAKMFSGEESYGRFFDLNSLHAQFVNLKRNRTINYARYLENFDNFSDAAFPSYVKQDPKYVDYLTDLYDYLESFYRRTVPLDDHNQVLKDLNDGFEAEWKSKGTTLGPGTTAANTTPTEGIWCEICQKMYSKQTVFDGHLNSKKHKAGMKASTNGDTAQQNKPLNSDHGGTKDNRETIARKEWMISKLGLKFSNVKAMTKSNVARKQTLTDKEWQAEQMSGSYLTLLPSSKSKTNGEGDDDGDGGSSDGGEGDDKIYNPLKLPLGWDGKPIPFWLWRLHGLGVEYPCEICGNHIYMGRKAFDRHFLEWRHVHGLRCLGISPGGSGLFDQITLIADAVSLWDRLQADARKNEKKRDENVEMEDESGNVMSEKVYNDLVAQGIL